METTEIRYHAEIVEEKCDGCRLCLPTCNYKALYLVPGEPTPMVDPWACTGCGSCVTACPLEAIFLRPRI